MKKNFSDIPNVNAADPEWLTFALKETLMSLKSIRQFLLKIDSSKAKIRILRKQIDRAEKILNQHGFEYYDDKYFNSSEEHLI